MRLHNTLDCKVGHENGCKSKGLVHSKNYSACAINSDKIVMLKIANKYKSN